MTSTFGGNNDSSIFLDFQEKFLREIFFPYIDQHDIKVVIDLGDTWDRRRYINFHTLEKVKRFYFDELAKRNIPLHILIGNHSTFFKNTNKVNNISLLLREYTNIHIIENPQILNVYGFDICCIPWICDENKKESFSVMKKAKTDLCMGHFPISGFVMNVGQVAEEGFDRTLFDKFDMVLSGHFHHRSSDGKIYYLGSQWEKTWADYGDQKGFHVLDLSTRDLDFIKNPFVLFKKIFYRDDMVKDMNYSEYENCHVKVYIETQINPVVFEKFSDNLYKANPLSASFIEPNSILTDTNTETSIYNTKDQVDTLSFIKTYIDQFVKPDNINLDKLKSEFTSLYKDAMQMEE